MGVLSLCEDDTFTEQQFFFLQLCNFLFSVLSVFGSSFILVNMLTLSTGKGISKLVTFLAFGDFGWSVSVSISSALLWFNRNLYSPTFCVLFRVLFQVFAGSSVFWTACISYYLWKALSSKSELYQRRNSIYTNSGMVPSSRKNSFENSVPMWIAFYLVSCLFPISLALVPALVPGWMITDNMGICFPLPKIHFLLWFGPILLAFVTSLIFYCLMLQIVKRSSASFSFLTAIYSLGKLSIPVHFRVSLYLFVFFICWSLDLVTFAIRYFSPNCQPFGLMIAYSVLLQSQGLFDALVYGITNKQFRAFYEGKLKFAIFILLLSPLIVLPAIVFAIVKRIQITLALCTSRISPQKNPKMHDDLLGESYLAPTYSYDGNTQESFETTANSSLKSFVN